MTSCSQNRHATELRHISKNEESRIRTYDGIIPTDLQSATLNRSVISSNFKNYTNNKGFLFNLLNFLGRHPL